MEVSKCKDVKETFVRVKKAIKNSNRHPLSKFVQYVQGNEDENMTSMSSFAVERYFDVQELFLERWRCLLSVAFWDALKIEGINDKQCFSDIAPKTQDCLRLATKRFKDHLSEYFNEPEDVSFLKFIEGLYDNQKSIAKAPAHELLAMVVLNDAAPNQGCIEMLCGKDQGKLAKLEEMVRLLLSNARSLKSNILQGIVLSPHIFGRAFESVDLTIKPDGLASAQFAYYEYSKSVSRVVEKFINMDALSPGAEKILLDYLFVYRKSILAASCERGLIITLTLPQSNDLMQVEVSRPNK